MYDASGKLPSGVLDGNYVELGSFDECLNVTTTRLSGKYCLGFLYVKDIEVVDSHSITGSFNGTHTMHFSTCIPSDCTALDVHRISAAMGIYLTIVEDFCQTADSQPEFDSLSITATTLFVCIALLMVVSIIYDLYNRFISNRVPNWVLSSFSVYINGKWLFTVKHNSKEIECLHGLRVLSMVAVLSFHSFFALFFHHLRNEYYLEHWIHQIQNMWLIKGDYAVDTFLLISGILVSYTFMLKTEKNHKFMVIYHYLNRYLRLTPSIAALILFVVGVLKFLGSGPLWPSFHAQIIGPCKEHWWYNLLYISNYKQGKCLGHTWYLSVDFQLFLISPIMLILLKRWPKRVLVATAFLTACCLAAIFAITWIFELRTSILFNIRNFSSYLPLYYECTATKAPCWLIGFMFGYLLHIAKRDKKMKRKAQSLLIVAVTVCFTCILSVFPTLNPDYSRIGSSLYLALATPAFSISIGWIIYCCHTGNGGIINTFLSHSVFKIISNLTYTIYLVHYPLVIYAQNRIRVPFFADNFGIFVYTIPGTLFLSFLLALLLSLAIELPVQTFVNVLMKKLHRK
ncbi:hypothetical protein RI129_011472 [Pyrocoelia pectoralis]|uniref:Nose resistant-to-fluoxetine protein N-terminal domain-containing protein n=1 Tax=Pyrocoelia pectoralis TaxID=417401 RepID=A0AAN7V830_9COLE